VSRKPVVARPTGRPVKLTMLEDEGHVLYYEDGRPPQDAWEAALSDADDFGRMKEGYVCARCFEDLDTPFPDECPVCKFPMRDEQSRFIAERFLGEKWVGPTTTLEEEAAIMLEMREKHVRDVERNSDILIAKPQIILPRGI